MHSLRYALRGFLRSPGFALSVVLLLAAGIGSNCVIFSALNAVLLRKLPVREPERLYRVVTDLPRIGKRSEIPYAVYTALRQHSTKVESVAGESSMDVAFTGEGLAERVRVHLVTPEYFAVLGIEAQVGRVLTPTDVTGAVLSYNFWQRRFAGDRSVIGRTIHLGSAAVPVVGVLPRSFSGFSIDTAPDVRIPIAAGSKPENYYLDLAVRLRPGVSSAAAQGEVSTIWADAQKWDSNNAWQRDRGVQLDPLLHGTSRLRERFSSALLILAAAVGLLLLMVCANVVGLLLARSAGRRQEIAVRLALGASRARLVRQMLVETTLLSVAGGAAGLALAYAAAPLLERALPPVRDFATVNLPLALHFSPDIRVFWFSLALCALTAVLAGLAPALAAARQDLYSPLRTARGSGAWTGRRALVIFEVALCTLLLAGAGLLVRTFRQLDTLDAGFDREHVVTFTTDPTLNGYKGPPAEALRLELENRARALPGVAAVGSSGMGLMRGTGMKATVAPMGQQAGSADFLNSSFQFATPEYFETMGIRVTAGRLPTAAEADRKPTAALVNETFVAKFFPGVDPLGRCFGGAMNKAAPCDHQIVGVVTDARYRSLREPIQPVFYRNFDAGTRESPRSFVLYVRTQARPESIINPVREVLRALDPALPFVEVHTLAEEAAATLWAERLTAALASVFGAIAALLAAAGLYGLLAYSVAQRSREIGIRMALGADAGNILRLIGGEAFAMVAIGVAVGLAATAAAGPAIRSILYGVQPSDLLSLMIATVLVLFATAIAVAIPVRRATRVDPALILKD